MAPREPKNPRVVLLEDHRYIDGLLDRLIATVRADDREAAQKTWKRVEGVLLTHLNVEEMLVFPALCDGHRAEIDQLRREHDGIRRQLGEIGLALDLHTVRCDAIETFCTSLREHAEREDSLAYARAAQTLPLSVARSIASRIKAVAASVRKPRGRASVARSAS